MRKEVKKIINRIKKVEIQGATNIAKAALKAYLLEPTREVKKALINSRPTEPMLFHVVNFLEQCHDKDKKKCVNVPLHFTEAQENMDEYVYQIIKNGDVIFTHCHSTNVGNALVYSKKKGKKFEVYNTETRPLYQGRKTAKELGKAGIKVTTFVDSAMAIALEKTQETKKVTKIFLGADAILKKGVINKVGSGMIAELAKLHKIPFYVVADSWKFFPKDVEIEERDFHEVWKNAPKKVKIRNPSFELIKSKYIKAIISELGVLSYKKFISLASRSQAKY